MSPISLMVGNHVGAGGRNPGVLGRAIAYAKASSYSGSGAWLDESGNGHDAQLGSTSGVDTTDPLFLQPDGYIRRTNAGTPYFYAPGVAGNYASIPDAAALHITGDIDIRCAVALTDWTPSIYTTFVARYQAANHAVDFLTDTAGTGLLALNWSADGATDNVVFSTVAPTVADGALLLVRVTLDVDNGATGHTVTFYTKTSTAANAYTDLMDNTGWTQLGAQVTAAGVTSVFAATAPLEIGYGTASGFPATAKFYAAALLNGINGTTAFAGDFTLLSSYNAAKTSLTAVSGQTITINRSSTGRKSVIVDEPLFLLGTDDYFEIADHADLDFAATDDLTLAVKVRLYGTTANLALLAKKQNLSTAAGYSLNTGTGGLAPEFTIADGTNSSVDVGPTVTQGVDTVIVGRRSVVLDQIEAYSAAVPSGSPTTDATTATLANSDVLRLGRLSGAGTAQAAMVIKAFAVFRVALSDAEITALEREFL